MTFPFDFQVLLNTVITMFLILVVGFLARKLGFVNGDNSKFLSNFVICVAQPFLIVGSVVGIEYSTENVKTASFIIVLGAAIHIVTAVIAFFATFKMKNVDERRLTEYSMVFANCGFLGFPILKSMFGDIGLFWGSFYIVAFNMISWTYGMYILSKSRPQIKMSFIKIFLNYGSTPCIIGIVLFLLQVKIPAPITSVMDYIGSLCTPLTMIIVGGLLATVPFKKMFTSLKIYYQCVVRLFICPIVVTVLCRIVGLDSQMILFGTVMAALPTAANTVMFSEKFDIKSDFAAHGVGLTTLLSAVSIPAVVYIAMLIINI